MNFIRGRSLNSGTYWGLGLWNTEYRSYGLYPGVLLSMRIVAGPLLSEASIRVVPSFRAESETWMRMQGQE